MQVQNNNPVNFQGIRLNSSKMTKKQLDISEKFINSISYSDSFVNAHNEGVDIYLLPKNKTQVKVRFVDRISDMFFKTAKSAKKRLGFNIGDNSKIINAAERTEGILYDILDEKIARPVYSYEKIENSETDVARLRPRVYRLYQEDAKIFGTDLNYEKDEEEAHFLTMHSEF